MADAQQLTTAAGCRAAKGGASSCLPASRSSGKVISRWDTQNFVKLNPVRSLKSASLSPFFWAAAAHSGLHEAPDLRPRGHARGQLCQLCSWSVISSPTCSWRGCSGRLGRARCGPCAATWPSRRRSCSVRQTCSSHLACQLSSTRASRSPLAEQSQAPSAPLWPAHQPGACLQHGRRLELVRACAAAHSKLWGLAKR